MTTESEQSRPTSKPALKYLAYGVYLQLFLGVGFLALGGSGIRIDELFYGPEACGFILIFLGLNSLVYIQRYKKSLK